MVEAEDPGQEAIPVAQTIPVVQTVLDPMSQICPIHQIRHRLIGPLTCTLLCIAGTSLRKSNSKKPWELLSRAFRVTTRAKLQPPKKSLKRSL